MIRKACALCAAVVLLLLAGLIGSGLLPLPGVDQSPAGAADTNVQPAAKPAPPPPPSLPPSVGEVLQSGVLIVISKASQTMYVFKDGVFWNSSPVSTGMRGHTTPSGVFPILQKRVYHRSNLYSNAPMPYMQRLTWSGIAIHAGDLPGYPASHGCIRLPKDFARALFKLTNPARTTVVITDSAVDSSESAKALALATPMPGQPASPAQSAPRIDPLPIFPVEARAPVRGQTIQLAAAPSPDEAEAQWSRLVAAHPELAGFNKFVVPAMVGSRRVWRLRATAPDAYAWCAAQKRLGEDCFNVR